MQPFFAAVSKVYLDINPVSFRHNQFEITRKQLVRFDAFKDRVLSLSQLTGSIFYLAATCLT